MPSTPDYPLIIRNKIRACDVNSIINDRRHGQIDIANLHSDWVLVRLLNIGAYSDSDGRPLSEGKVPLERRRAGVAFELRPCPYKGARASARPDQLMNVSAMKRVRSTLAEAFGAFLYLRQKCISRLPHKELRFVDLWRIGMLTMALPRFLALRKVAPVPDGELPPYIADAQKFSAGITSLMLDLAVQEAIFGRPLSISSVTINSLMEQAERMLVGEKQVCAAPPSLIEEALRAFVYGRVHIKTTEPSLAVLISDFDALYSFASVFMDLKVFRWLITNIQMCILFQNESADENGSLRLKAECSRKTPPSNTNFTFGVASGMLSDTLLKDSRLTTLNAISAVMAQGNPSEQYELAMLISRKLISQRGIARTRLVEAYRRAAKLLQAQCIHKFVRCDMVTHLSSLQNRTMRMNTSYISAQCGQVRAASLKVLEALECGFRTSLKHTPTFSPASPQLYELINSALHSKHQESL